MIITPPKVRVREESPISPFSIKMGDEEAFSGLVALYRREGMDDHADTLLRVLKEATVTTFEADPVRNLTDSMMKERVRLVGRIIVEKILDEGWTLARIRDEIVNLVLEKLDAKQTMTRQDRRWGVVEEQQMELGNESYSDRPGSHRESKIIL